jgi:hypothetical protein
VLTATNKWLLIFESRDDSNRCTPCRENLIHMTHTLFTPVHLRHSYDSCGHSSYVVIFHESSIVLDRVTAPKKRNSQLHPSTPADRSASPHPVSLHLTTNEVVEKVKHPLTNKLHWFTGPISPACDRYVQYLLTGVNPSVLN